MLELDKLKEYYDRLEKLNLEAYELDQKCAKLQKFIETIDCRKNIDDTMKELMVKQSKAMSSYSDILHKRIQHLHKIISIDISYEGIGCMYE